MTGTNENKPREADAIVVGSGAGGGTMARELTRAGLSVTILERGKYHRRFLGTHLGAARMAERAGFYFSKEGVQCVRGLTTGGSTMMTCGTFRDPAPFIKEKLSIDLAEEIRDVREDLGVGKLPDRIIEGTSTTLLTTANKLGYNWEVFEKFINPELCRENCSRCMMACPTGAKWTSRRFVDEAVAGGATLVQRFNAQKVIHANGRVEGVSGFVGRSRKPVEYRAPLVILAAGGMGSAPILRRTGIKEAGKGIFIDPVVITYGTYKGKRARAGTRYNPPMTVGSWEFYESEGFMVSPLNDPWLLFAGQMAMVKVRKAFKVFRFLRTMGIMTKIRDDMEGEVFEDGSFSKPMTAGDRKKLDRGAEISEEILVAAGCNRKSITRSAIRGTHPGGACRIGTVVDENLETRINNLYVSDASVFPEALGTPVVATVAAMTKRLAKHILSKR